jgi:DNA-cytosine methyltransferase
MKVLSLFDGISGAQLALEELEIEVDAYYASEIDKYAIAITQFNHPDTIQLGDITKWQEWDIPFGEIDLVIGGSPCTQLSRAGNGRGLEGSDSRLFYDFVDILEHVKELNPDVYFLLENVKMKQEWQDEMTEIMGVEPILIDSALVSAQRRERLYWTNIPNVTQPEDRGIELVDVLYPNVFPVAIHNIYGGFSEPNMRAFLEKSPTIRANSGGGSIPSAIKIEAVEHIKELREELALSEKGLAYMNRRVADGRTHWDFAHHSDIRDSKSATVVANWAKGVPYNVLKDVDGAREFHPTEVERLQTFYEGYTAMGDFGDKTKPISKTQRLRALGNSFTVDVIVHILSFIK